MKWDHDDYEEWINQGHPINAKILELDISYYDIKSLEPIKNLINLKKLYCRKSNIESLEPINNLVKLKILDCAQNQIQSLETNKKFN